jgi:hypothetical protein
MQQMGLIDGAASILEPSTLLPSQFFAAMRQKAEADGERRLMFAILEDAIECFQKHLWAEDNKRRQLHLDAESWFLEDDLTWLFSFVNICDVFEIHPVFLRQGLLAWKTKQLAEGGMSPTDIADVSNDVSNNDVDDMPEPG